MKKSISILFITAAFASSAFADNAAVTHTAQGTVETTKDTSHNPLTGNDTTTTEVKTKDHAGNTTSTHKVKAKHGKNGDLKSKEVTNEQNSGTTTGKSTSEETHK